MAAILALAAKAASGDAIARALLDRTRASSDDIRHLLKARTLTDESTFHESSGTVRFWVPIGEQHVGASVGKETLHYRYHPSGRDDTPLATFAEHLEEIHAAVRLRVANGSVEPVMLRDADLRASPTAT